MSATSQIIPDSRPDGLDWGAGCGDAKTDKWVPDSFFGIVSFAKACDKHDKCYDTFGSDKLVCDNELQADMKSACAERLKGVGRVLYPLCSLQGSFYGFAVRNFGDSAYDKAQEKAFLKMIEQRAKEKE